jgi:hypothetical protein
VVAAAPGGGDGGVRGGGREVPRSDRTFQMIRIIASRKVRTPPSNVYP